MNANEDYLTLDNLVSVTLFYLDGSLSNIDNVHRNPIGVMEAAASGGAFVASDKGFVISSREAPAPPQVRGRIDDGETTYTILSIIEREAGDTYRCVCRDLKAQANLTLLADLQERTLGQSPEGDPTYVWNDVVGYTDIAAAVRAMSADEKERQGGTALQTEYVLILDRTVPVSVRHRFHLSDGKYWYVKGWRDADRIDYLFRVYVEPGTATGPKNE